MTYDKPLNYIQTWLSSANYRLKLGLPHDIYADLLICGVKTIRIQSEIWTVIRVSTHKTFNHFF